MQSGPITIIEFDHNKTLKDYFNVFLRNPEFGEIISRYARAVLNNDAERASNYLSSELWSFLSNGTMDFDDDELDEIFEGLLNFIKAGSIDHIEDLLRSGIKLSERPDKEPALNNRVLIPKLCASIKRRLTAKFG